MERIKEYDLMSDFVDALGFGALNAVLAAFRSNEGYAQPNKYEVMINPPSSIKIDKPVGTVYGSQSFSSNKDLEEICLRAESVTIPGRNLATSTDENIYGPTREVVEGVTYAEDITLSFQSSSDLKERIFFEKWQQAAFDEDSWNIKYYDTYVGSIEIYLLDKQMARRYGIKLEEAFPKTVSAISLGYANNNSIIKTDVSFSFRYWRSMKISDQPKNILGGIIDATLDTVQRKLMHNVPASISKLF
jgi:hypothetical protein